MTAFRRAVKRGVGIELDIHLLSDGNLAVIRYYDADGNPAPNDGGYAVMTREYDDDRNVVSEQYLDAAGNPVALGAN